LLAAALLAAVPAHSAEIFAGVSAHAVDFPTSICCEEKGEGTDIQFGWRSSPIVDLKVATLRAQLLGSVNTAGGISYGAAGLVARFNLGPLYLQPGLGLAVHDGPSGDDQPIGDPRRHMGSRVLFEPEAVIGWRVLPGIAAELAWTHISHAQIFSHQNPGMDQIGVRAVVKF
jgi:hypothetical protein